MGPWVAHSSPSFLAMSPMEMPGFSSLIRGRWSEQKTKKAELEKQRWTPYSQKTEKDKKSWWYGQLTVVFWVHWGPSSSCPSSCPWEGRTTSSPCHNGPCQFWPSRQTSPSPWLTWSIDLKTEIKLIFFTCKSGTSSQSHQLTFHLSEHFLENSAKLTLVPGCFFLCSSRQVATK